MRLYITPSWRDAAEGHDAWSMESPDDRKRRSHTLPNGNANLQSYSDEAIGLAIGEKNKPKPNIKDKILPQARRLSVLREQMLELETSYRSGEMDVSEYSLLRDIIVAKIQRQEVLYKRAASVKPIRPEAYEDEGEIYASGVYPPSDNNGHRESYSSPVGVSFFAEVIDELSDSNSLKSFLKMSCKLIRKAVQLSQAARNYIKTLSEV